MRLLIFTQVLSTFGFGYFITYLTVYLPEVRTARADAIGIILGVESAVLVVAGIPLGLLSDCRGRKRILVVGGLLLAPAIMIFALTKDLQLSPLPCGGSRTG